MQPLLFAILDGGDGEVNDDDWVHTHTHFHSHSHSLI